MATLFCVWLSNISVFSQFIIPTFQFLRQRLTLVDLNGKTKSDGVGAPGVTLTQGIMDKKHNSRHCCS